MSIKISKTKKEKIIEKCGLVCGICGKELSKDEICIDHIIPVKSNGSNSIENLSILCKFCNSKKGSKNSFDFKKDRIICDVDFYKKLCRYELRSGVVDFGIINENLRKILKEIDLEKEFFSKLMEDITF